jgi:hypothetical protein
VDVTRDLAVMLGRTSGLRRRQGVVTAVNTDGTVDLTLAASTDVLAGVARLDHVSTQVGDTVWLLQDQSDLLVIGEVVARAPAAPYAVAAGAATVTLASASTGTVTVTLPTSRFTIAPIVLATVQTSTFWVVGVTAVSATSVDLSIRHINGTLTTGTVPLHWQAIQMTPTSASG